MYDNKTKQNVQGYVRMYVDQCRVFHRYEKRYKYSQIVTLISSKISSTRTSNNMQIKLLSIASLAFLFAAASAAPAGNNDQKTQDAAASGDEAAFNAKVAAIQEDPEIKNTLEFLIQQIAGKLNEQSSSQNIQARGEPLDQVKDTDGVAKGLDAVKDVTGGAVEDVAGGAVADVTNGNPTDAAKDAAEGAAKAASQVGDAVKGATDTGVAENAVDTTSKVSGTVRDAIGEVGY
ncbi:hypothetical protein BD408DRAFT_422805 [Parasitella parasitica]|nr:hypothetical protein BD408DRAFT_422805 [Parasitella parasitica]